MKRTPEQLAAIRDREQNRRIANDLEWWSEEEYGYEYSWQRRLERYRQLLELVPDKRRVINKGDETRIDLTAGPCILIERAIEDAQRAGDAGDLDAFAQAIERIVSGLHEQAVPMHIRAAKSKTASENASNPRPSRRGMLLKIISIIDAKDAADAERAFRDGRKLEIDGCPVILSYHPGDNKPYHANGEAWSRANLATKISIRNSKR